MHRIMNLEILKSYIKVSECRVRPYLEIGWKFLTSCSRNMNVGRSSKEPELLLPWSTHSRGRGGAGGGGGGPGRLGEAHLLPRPRSRRSRTSRRMRRRPWTRGSMRRRPWTRGSMRRSRRSSLQTRGRWRRARTRTRTRREVPHPLVRRVSTCEVT